MNPKYERFEKYKNIKSVYARDVGSGYNLDPDAEKVSKEIPGVEPQPPMSINDISESLGRLTEREREIQCMWYGINGYEEKTIPDIASMYDISELDVIRLLLRGDRKIRDEIWHKYRKRRTVMEDFELDCFLTFLDKVLKLRFVPKLTFCELQNIGEEITNYEGDIVLISCDFFEGKITLDDICRHYKVTKNQIAEDTELAREHIKEETLKVVETIQKQNKEAALKYIRNSWPTRKDFAIKERLIENPLVEALDSAGYKMLSDVLLLRKIDIMYITGCTFEEAKEFEDDLRDLNLKLCGGDDFIFMTLEDFDLTPFTYSCLKGAGYNTVDELTRLEEGEWLRIKNINRKCLTEIQVKFCRLGIMLMSLEHDVDLID